MEETHHRWRFRTLPLSLRKTEYRDRVEPTTRIIPRRLKTSCVGYCPGFQDLHDEIDVDGDLRVDNVIQNSEHEYSENEDSDLDNPLLPLPHPEPPVKEFDFEKEISDYPSKIEYFLCRILS
nr:hypothetical protein [Tanacetum cinerariifolium]